MISDTLHVAVLDIDAYLEKLPRVYEGELRTMILELRDHMDEVRRHLDTPPGTEREYVLENETRK